ncbi:MAG: DUF3592 domain-containing protein [Brevefilum sp.]|nr:DUF3592 domain-containing protein [Brevefilum sp.]
MDSVWFNLFLVVGFGVALLFGWFAVKIFLSYQHTKQKLADSQFWQEGEASILAAEVERIVRRDEDSRTVTFLPRVSYTYAVEGQEFHGEQIGFGKFEFSAAKKANAIVENHPVGENVQVFYNPLDPQEAVLERTIYRSSSYLVSGVILILVMLVMIGMLIFWWLK